MTWNDSQVHSLILFCVFFFSSPTDWLNFNWVFGAKLDFNSPEPPPLRQLIYPPRNLHWWCSINSNSLWNWKIIAGGKRARRGRTGREEYQLDILWICILISVSALWQPSGGCLRESLSCFSFSLTKKKENWRTKEDEEVTRVIEIFSLFALIVAVTTLYHPVVEITTRQLDLWNSAIIRSVKLITVFLRVWKVTRELFLSVLGDWGVMNIDE